MIKKSPAGQGEKIACLLRPAEMTSPEQCLQCIEQCSRNKEIRRFLSSLDRIKVAYLREQKITPVNPLEAIRSFSIVRDLAKRYWGK